MAIVLIQLLQNLPDLHFIVYKDSEYKQIPKKIEHIYII